jgi:hypothetical protein
MPHKFNADRRAKIPKQKRRVIKLRRVRRKPTAAGRSDCLDQRGCTCGVVSSAAHDTWWTACVF